MEDSWENWISSLEMAEDNSTDHSHINEDNFLTGIVLEPLDFSFLNSSTTTTMLSYDDNHDNSNSNNVFSMESSYENANFDERHGKMLKSNSSSSIISHDVANNNASSSSSAPSSSTFILSFENSTMEPSHHRPNKDHGSCPRNALCSSLLSSENDHLSTPKAKQGAKKYRSSSEIQDHIMAERKRRQELTERFIALSATIPGLKKTDKAYILREAMIYMKELQERVIELEKQNKRKRSTESRILIKKYSQREEERSTHALPHVEARVLEKEVLIGIHCHKQKDIVLKIMALLQNHHLSLASSSVLPFGTSTLKVTIIAQMDEQYCMTVNNLVKSLRQALLKIT
ncbi:transcription factor bHLH18-like [Vigna umbellata]|uniref:transcription factor bHLH18-like n=1 Tax=Vigna umbellata TaxID=87088 RepID=UPI001F5F96E2|nr:transcription factor bHLH18-like [Vigna umbellata]